MSRIQKSAAAGPDWRNRLRPLLRIGLLALLLLFGLAAGFLLPYLYVLDRRVSEDFSQLTWQVPTRVHARPLLLQPGLPLDPETLQLELDAAAYRNDGKGLEPGSYSIGDDEARVSTRGFVDVDGPVPARRLHIAFAGGRVSSLRLHDGSNIASARVDPARIATLYGAKREERRLVRLEDAPELLVMTLQAVEDRDFKHHSGVDWSAMTRALWVNLTAGEVRQGGSTLTQQLVRNLYLTREQTYWRKFREVLHALVMEHRFEKSAILEAYINQVYLGQDGGQAIHGFAAASEFWFGRELAQLGPAEIALLVGMVRGPSLYDPRRHPNDTTARRNRVLRQMAETGLIDADTADRLAAGDLGVRANAGVASNRAPAFLDLVRLQLGRDYPADALSGAGLAVMTTLAPSTQRYAESAARAQLAALVNPDRPPLQIGLVVSDSVSGEVRALLGGADGGAGFNRALDARRPVGSLLKPFVHLLALAQPGRYSLASRVQDTPIELRLPNGQTWSPANSDEVSHGEVALLDALVHSYNQATVRVGMDIGVERLSQLMEALSGIRPAARPSLLLGAVDLSPYQMTQLYQFLASGGQVQPLRSLRGVIDADGVALNRYDAGAEPAQPGDALAARLVGVALQRAVTEGTARRLQADGLGWLRSAGKTGTSNDSRDSWFAGYTGSHLAVVWIGNDDNLPTGLYGASGAMRVWSALFADMPTAPLDVGGDGLEWAWVDVAKAARTDENCPDARSFPFVAGFVPAEYDGCPMNRLREFFGGGDER